MRNSILKHLSSYKKETILGPLFKLLEASFELFVPLVVSNIIDIGIKTNNINYIFWQFILLFSLALIGMICAITAQYFSAKAAVGFSTKVRQNLFDKIQTFDFNTLDSLGTSNLVNHCLSDVNQIQTGVNLLLRLFLRSPFVVFGAMIMAFTINVKIALLFVLAIVILSLIVFSIMLITIPLYKKVQNKNSKLLSLTRENLIGVRVVRAFNKENDEINNFNKHSTLLTKEQRFVSNISSIMNPFTFIVINMIIVWLIYSGALQVNVGNLSSGNVVALYNYMGQILVELVKLANLIIQLTKAFASKNRIEKVLNTENTLIKKPFSFANENLKFIEFKNVSMAYPNAKENSIENISFTINKGETIGIIGSTGSGKSTLVNLIPHFYDATKGEVFVDGINVNEYDDNVLREKIGFAFQKSTIFSGTIRENLLMGKRTATELEIENALKTSQALDFVNSKENKLDFVLEQNGRNLSGGQRQRLNIARAIIKKPDILILDDTSSALDYKTESELRKALKEFSKDLTTIIVSQRTSSITHADKIIVLDDGKMVGIGKHEELLNSCEVYKEIYSSQFKGGIN